MLCSSSAAPLSPTDQPHDARSRAASKAATAAAGPTTLTAALVPAVSITAVEPLNSERQDNDAAQRTAPADSLSQETEMQDSEGDAAVDLSQATRLDSWIPQLGWAQHSRAFPTLVAASQALPERGSSWLQRQQQQQQQLGGPGADHAPRNVAAAGVLQTLLTETMRAVCGTASQPQTEGGLLLMTMGQWVRPGVREDDEHAAFLRKLLLQLGCRQADSRSRTASERQPQLRQLTDSQGDGGGGAGSNSASESGQRQRLPRTAAGRAASALGHHGRSCQCRHRDTVRLADRQAERHRRCARPARPVRHSDAGRHAAREQGAAGHAGQRGRAAATGLLPAWVHHTATAAAQIFLCTHQELRAC